MYKFLLTILMLLTLSQMFANYNLSEEDLLKSLKESHIYRQKEAAQYETPVEEDVKDSNEEQNETDEDESSEDEESDEE